MAQAGTHTVRVTLVHEPSVYREFEVDSSKSLYRLAEAIVAAFGFDFDHAFGFYSGRTERTLMSAKPKYELFADMGRDAFGDKSDALSVKKTRIIDLSEGRACHDLPVRLRRRMALPGRGGRPWPEGRKGALPQGAEGGGSRSNIPIQIRTTQKNIREGVSRARKR